METKQQTMPILVEHPEISSNSILKRRNKFTNQASLSTKTVNFSEHPEGQFNGNHSSANYDYSESKNDTNKEGDRKLRRDESIATPEQQKILSWRRSRSHSMPLNKLGANPGVMVEGTRFFILKNRTNAKDANVELFTFARR